MATEGFEGLCCVMLSIIVICVEESKVGGVVEDQKAIWTLK